MTPEDAQKIKDQVATIGFKIDALIKLDRYQFDRDIALARGKKIKGGIFAGSDSAPPPGWVVTFGSGGSAGQNHVAHNLGTDNYKVVVTVIGSTNEAFQVGVANLTSTGFDIYTSQGGSLVARHFHFIVMPT
jgi:hypothetical protein